jgi:flagellar hook-basal body complex protein FliE
MTATMDPAAAAGAYGRGAALGHGTAGGGGVLADKPMKSFQDFLAEKTRDVVDTLHRGEAMTAQAVAGRAPLPALVQAVTGADMALQTLVALRDRMVSAYQTIMRMPL